ncbi:RNA polymerase sigma factor [Flavobacterium sp. ALD4]|uniref:RNA polymerase sigma factor n=1 Tax=Flavobacterium sp. ALD4 TaxID=2058314 RepID=UPI001E48611B|nr:RNA polymerase sigma-70 factor [Flavobacterium sp. ALD4]
MMEKNFQIKDPNSPSLINFRDIVSQQLKEEIKQKAESQIAEVRELYAADLEILNKPKKDLEKKQESKILQELAEKQLIEVALISRLKEGNEKAYNELYQLYYSDLCNYASNLCGNDDLAEDIVQHTMIKIWKKGLDLNVNTSLKGYLLKSIYNHFIDIQRKTKKETNKLERLKQEGLLDFVEFSIEEIENTYRRIDLEIENLPKQCREVFLLGKKEGLKYKEIAIKLNISVKTVERHMSIALKKLRKKLNYSSAFLYLFLTNLT